VEGIVWNNFMAEVVPSIQRQVEEESIRQQPEASWMFLADWCYYQGLEEDCSLMDAVEAKPALVSDKYLFRIKRKSICRRGSGAKKICPEDSEYSFNIIDVMSKTLAKVLADTHSTGTQLSVTNGDVFWVKDNRVAHFAHSDWMSYDDWRDYREGHDGRKLVNLRIRFDANLAPVCSNEAAMRQFGCLSGLDDPMGHTVSTTVKTLYGLSRIVYADSRESSKFDGSGSSSTCYVTLTKRAKMCLWVHDPLTSQKLATDSARRARDAAWQEGSLPASESLADSLIKAMRQVKPGAHPLSTAASEAVAGQKVLKRQLAHRSYEFELYEDLQGKTNMESLVDDETAGIMSELQAGFREDLSSRFASSSSDANRHNALLNDLI